MASGCVDIDTALDFVAGRLEAAQRDGLDQHLASCAVCRGLVATAASALDTKVDTDAEANEEPVSGPSANEELVSGSLVDRYRIEGLLGRGGMGLVYLARDTSLDRLVALKLIDPRRETSASYLERFGQEARATARLSHPQIVTLYDVGQHKGAPFLALEYVAGETLRQRLLRGPLAVGRALRIGVELADALGAAHAEGVFHLDLKPDNVMLGDDGRARVLDFGLAQVLAAARVTPHVAHSPAGSGPVGGTPLYMSPEQARGAEVTGKADIWALGLVLAEALSGRRPSSKEEPASSPDLGDVPGVSARLVALVDACLAPDPDRRPDPTELKRRLALAAKEHRRARGRRLRVIIAFCALTVLALGATWLALTFARQRRVASDAQRSAERARAASESRLADALREAAQTALQRGELLQARSKLRMAFELRDSPLARALYWRLDEAPLLWRVPAPTSLWTRILPGGRAVLAAGADGLVLRDPQTSAVMRRGHAGAALTPAVDRSGGWLAFATGAGIVLWHPTRKVRRQLAVKPRIWQLCFDPSGRRLAAALGGGEVWVFDVASGRRELKLSGHAVDARSVAFGDRVIVSGGTRGRVVLWDAASGARLAQDTLDMGKGEAGAVARVLLSPDGRKLVVARADSVQVHAVPILARLHQIPAHAGKSGALSFSAHGRKLLVGGKDPSWWEVSTGERLARLSGIDEVKEIKDLAVEGGLVASTDEHGTLSLWRADRLRQPRAVAGHSQMVYGIAFLPGDQQVVSAGWDGTLRLWEVATGKLLRVIEVAGRRPLLYIDVAPSGAQVAAAARDGTVRLWRLPDGAPQAALYGHKGQVTGIAFHPSRPLLASGAADGKLKLWNPQRGVLLASTVAHAVGGVWDVRFTGDGRSLVTVGRKAVRVWRLLAGDAGVALVAERKVEGGVAAATDPLGKRIAITTAQKNIEIWELGAAKRSWQISLPARPYSLDFGPRGVLLGAPMVTGESQVWRIAATGDAKRQVSLLGHQLEVNTLRFSHDGRLVATAGDDGTLRLWEVASGKPLWGAGQAAGSPASATPRVALGATGKALVGDAEGRVFVVRASDGKQLVALEHVTGRPATRLARGPAGTAIAGFADGRVAIYELGTGRLLRSGRLHGKIVELALAGHRLKATSDLGASLRWNLEPLVQDYCELLRRIWRQRWPVWPRGRPVAAGAPDGHLCVPASRP